MSRQFSQPAPGGAVTGRKSVRRQAQGLVIEYDLASTADEPLSVRLSDGVPTARAAEFGFHEDHEPEEWTLSDGDLEMTVPLDPGADRTVVFGLVADGDGLAYDPAEPSVEVEARDAGGTGDAPDGDALDAGDAVTATGDGEPGAATDDGGFFDETGPSVENGDGAGGVDLAEPVDEDHRPAEVAGGGPRVDADGGVVDSGRRSASGVVSTLVDELEAGTVSESELDALRDHLGVDRPRSEAARLEYVQKRLGDFDAYVDALEELLSVHGSGDDALTELEGRFEGIADEVESVRERQDELADRIDDLAAALETHEGTVESLQVAHEEDVAEVRSELRDRDETVREEVAELRQSVDADLAALEAEIETFESIRRTLVDGLRRPEGADEDSTVGDAEPDTVSEIEDVPTVEPSAPDDGESTDEAGDPDGPGEVDESGSSDGPGDVDGADEGDGDRAVEESLETAVASNFSGNATDDGAEAATGDGTDEDTAPDADEDPEVDAAPVLSLEASSTDEDDQDDEVRTDDERTDDGTGQPDDGFVSPVLDDGDALGEDTDGAEVEDVDISGDEDGDVDASADEDDEEVDLEIPELDPDGEDGIEDPVLGDSDDDGDDGDDGDGKGRATSIFEIGDVDSEAGGGEEKPTIDFEDG